jgi:hypothetical protein
LEHGSHTEGRLHIGEIGKGKKTKNLNVVDVFKYSNEYSNLKLAEAAMGRGLGNSKEVW